MLMPAIFDIISGSSREKSSDLHPFRPDLVEFFHHQSLFVRRPGHLLMRIDQIVVVSVAALAGVPTGHESADG
jgi:hypothetical protein